MEYRLNLIQQFNNYWRTLSGERGLGVMGADLRMFLILGNYLVNLNPPLVKIDITC